MRKSSIAQRFVRPVAAALIAVLTIGAIPSAGSAQAAGGEEAGEEVDVRIVARRLEDGRVEFGLQQRGADGSWGERLLPSRRFFPADAGVGSWLASSRLVLSVGSVAFDDPGEEVDVRIVARRLEDGRVEFGLQQRGADGSWGERLLPSRRFFPATAGVGSWLASSPLSVNAGTAASIQTTRRSPSPGAAFVAASGYHTCAINAKGSVDCWGDNSVEYRIGVPSVHQARSPVPVGGLTGAVAISIGGSEGSSFDGPTCVLHSDGSVSCWGSDYRGAMGQGTPGEPPLPQPEPSGGDPTVPVAVVLSGLGEPTRIPGLSDAVAVSAGDEHVCVVHADGGVSCWGGNHYGQLGDGTRQSRNWPYRIPGLSDVTAIGAARSHSCAVHSDGTISCWGLNYSGQLGDGTTSSRYSPVNVYGIADAVSVALSSGRTCAVRRSGRISCWGSNSESYYDNENRGFASRTGILGTGSRRSRELLPAPVRGISDAVAVAVGGWSSCALHRDGTVSCWGTNTAGQLGIGTEDHSNEPQKLRGVENVISITVSEGNAWSESNACAVTTDGNVLCWGGNRFGQLGVGDTGPRLAPTGVAAPGARTPEGWPTVFPQPQVPDWSDEEWRIDPGPFREAMDDVVRDNERAFPWLRIAWDHVRDDVRIFEAASGGVTTVSCGFFDPGSYECRTSRVALGTALGERSMRELLYTGVHELAHVYDGATAFTPDRAWGAVQLYFADKYPRCHDGGEEAIADAMLHLVFPDAPLTYYRESSGCPDTPVTPTEEDEAVLRSGLAGEVPSWYTTNVTDGGTLWWIIRGVSNLSLLANLMGEFGGLCRTDFLMNWRIAPSRDENPFADGGC